MSQKEDFFLFVFLALLLLVLGGTCGLLVAKEYYQKAAVSAGHATWADQKDGSCRFEWKETNK